ncbi:hypothetical protein HYH03_006141 [Edaphochlamys debaryana]|uniref:Alkaline phosphatase n=1 Tax=Edaphochlamys debaryana TaxID=47281 RepID=A0A835YE31_9CHLO|nr:hypothetical protein HYH03_006141 [Edaphochlamys debaryana]|eukprot:KAG2495904.1 hypothetical protein HYH03_006141 [Edaphochlamys debaryana]
MRAFVVVAALCLGVASIHAAIHFPGVPFPFANEEKHSILSVHHTVVGEAQILKTNAAGRASKVQGGFQVLARTGVPGGPGDVYDVEGKPVLAFGANYTKGTTYDTSVNPDFTSLLPRKGDPNKVDLFVHFESPLPASVYHMELLVAADGALAVMKQQRVNWTAWGGIWTPCAGSITPWGTHLGSEEYEPDARAFYGSDSVNSRVRDMARYYGLYLGDFESRAAFMTEVRKVMHPYKYGYVTEVMYDEAAGAPVARKWYSLGRVAVEMGLVMPDEKTVYITDDGREVGFFMYKATKAGDLSRGRLYAAKFNQSSAEDGGVFNVTWVDLGATDHDVLAAAMPNTTFDSIFETADPAAGACPANFTAVKHSYGEECLKLKEGMEMHAAGFETRRYAAYLGATTEWTKWEGITYDPKRHRLYTAMTELNSGTSEEPRRFGGHDDVRLPENRCGCVYEMDLDKSYTATSMSALTCGNPDLGIVPGLLVNNTCHIDRIASPDNVWYDGASDVLYIAEDTDHHENNFLWSYDLASGDMTRVLSVPVGAEVTGTAVFTLPSTGMTYVWNNFQHPYSGSAFDAASGAPEATGKGGYVGYFGPFKIEHGQALGLQHVPAPTTAAAKHAVVSSSRAVVGQRLDTGFKSLARSGDVYGNATLGALLDRNLAPVYHYIEPALIVDRAKPEIANSTDFTYLNAVCDRTFFTTQYEYPNPSSMYMQRLEQNLATGAMEPGADATYVNWHPWGGLLTPCAGSGSPWGTRMGSEEYEPDARAWDEATTLEHIGGGANSTLFSYDGGNLIKMGRAFGLYYGEMTLEQFKADVKPYLYGYVTEVKVQYDMSYVPTKHYTLGRVATELGLVMPDKRTVYITDDGTNVGFFKFVADTPGDLSVGSLYAAKAIQTSAVGGGRFRIDWIWLGHASQDMLINVASSIAFSDIFEGAAPSLADNSTSGPCPEGFRPMNQGGRGCECLKVKEGMETYAAFFETRRYAAYLGATTEWSKWEGITYDASRRRLYTAMSDVRQGMEDMKSRGRASSAFDACTNNDLRVEYNRCGCVYQLHLDGAFGVYGMDELVCGRAATDPAAPGFVKGNNCAMDGIANPDNIAYSPEHDVLFIGEDTSEHENDVIWAFDIETAALTRIYTTPYGAETTGPYWYGDINGHGYVTAVTQHPYGESDAFRLNETEAFGGFSVAGVIGPFPAVPLPPSASELGSKATNFWASWFGMGMMGDFDDGTAASKCASEDALVVTVQVSYERTPLGSAADVERVDAYVCSRVDNMLVRLAGKDDDATQVATRCLRPAEGETEGLVLAHVQFGDDKEAAKAFRTAVTDRAGDLRAQLSQLFTALSAPGSASAYSGFWATADSARKVPRTRAFTPPTQRLD